MRKYLKNIISYKVFSLLATLSFLFFSPIYKADATLSLRITPVDGGSSIRFGRVDLLSATNKEVRIRVVSDEGRQYQIFQRIVDPFVNERGESLSRSSVAASTLTGSNAAGTLYLQELEPVGFSEQVIYTSDPVGSSDSFTIVYQVDQNTLTRSGEFFGKVLYSVRSIGTSSRDEIVLNVFLETIGKLEFEVDGSSQKDAVRLRSAGVGEAEDYVQISYSGHTRKDLKIYQEIIKPLADEMNNGVDEQAILLVTTGGREGGLDYQTSVPLQNDRILLYQSTSSGDSFLVHFQLDPDQRDKHRAGTFRGTLRYTLETDDIVKTEDIDIEMQISPIFEMIIDYPPGGVSFSRLLMNTPPQIKEVKVTVKTNLGRPFVVSQMANGPLTNESGQEIEDNYFQIKQEVVGGHPGQMSYPEFTPFLKGERPLYYSDSHGSPVTFKVFYRLQPYQQMSAGDYKTAIVYTLGEK